MTTRYRHSLGIRHLTCGSCNGCEHEMSALESPLYDLTAQGWQIVASPRHADVITVTGPMTEGMRSAASKTLEAAAQPCVTIAIGDCAITGGVWQGAPHAGAGAGTELQAQVRVPGCPPSPAAICEGLREAAELLARAISVK